MEILIVTTILVVTLVLLVSERIPVDLTAVGIMVALMLTGVLPPLEAVQGFANPAVVTVAAMFLISRALIRTGAVGFIGQKVISYSRGNPKLALILVMVIVAVASAFINNTPIVVLFIPVVLSLSCEYQISPSQLLIPVSYASILAGTSTLIGTSTNIIVSDLSATYGFGKLSMFELSALGVPIAIVGMAFIYIFSPRILPSLTSPICEIGSDKGRKYLAELMIHRNSPLLGRDPQTAFGEKYPSIQVTELIRYNHIFYPGRDRVMISNDDMLLVKGSAGDLVAALQDETVELTPSENGLKFGSDDPEPLVVELIITPQSTLRGTRLRETHLRRAPQLRIIALEHSGQHFTGGKIHDVRLRTGDILLIQCPEKSLERLRGSTDYIVVEDVQQDIVLRRKARTTAIIFAGIVVGATTGVADIMTCALAGAFLMILLRCIRIREAYGALQGDVLVLIAGTIALGAAMEKTGASRLYAEMFLSLFKDGSPSMILAGFMLLTSVSTQILSNNATAVLLLPVAISTALSIGVDPKPFIIAVCFGASACFATPIGYQTNLLVYGPGGYRFSDYLKLGIPLNLIVLVMGGLFIPRIWPF